MQAIATQTAINATPDLAIIDGQITTTSQQIAGHFGKAHRSVLLAIRRLECPKEFTEHNFVLSEYTDSTGRKLPAYRITRDGFTLLAMGFTGKEALRWKLAYIEAFNKMETQLSGSSAQPAPYSVRPSQTLSAAQAQTLRMLLTSNAQRLPKEKQAVALKKGWSKLKSHFGVSYRQIPAHEFNEAVSILTRHVVDWELVDTPAPVSASEMTINEWVAKMVEQINVPNGHPAMLFIPLVEAVNRKLQSNKQLPEKTAALPAPVKLSEAQIAAIDERMNRVAGIFHPFSPQFADLIGIRRVLKGQHPNHCTPVLGYRAVI